MARPRTVRHKVNGAIYSVLCVDTDTRETCIEDVTLGKTNLSNKQVIKVVESYLPRCMRPVAVLSSIAYNDEVEMPEEIYLAFATPVKRKRKEKQNEQEIQHNN